MLDIILGIFGSGGFGSLLGIVGGYFNRKLDIQGRKLEIEDKVNDRAHELVKMEKEVLLMKAESDYKIQIATTEADALVEKAGYEAMKESYNFAKTSSEDGLVDKFSRAVRPSLTLAFFLFSVAIFYQVTSFIYSSNLSLKPEEILKLWILIIEWVLFQSGVCIGWWFAMRPGKPQKFTTN